MDLLYVVQLYEKYRKNFETKIIISGCAENLHFLRSINIPEEAIKYLNIKSKLRKFGLLKLIKQLYTEKKMMDSLIKEITQEENNELFFSSYDNDPHMGYLTYQVSKSNSVTLIDVLEIRPIKMRSLRILYFKNVISWVIYSLIFGNIFIIAGSRSIPTLSSNLNKYKINIIPRNDIRSLCDISKYKIKVAKHKKCALILYDKFYFQPYEKQISTIKNICELLINNNFIIYLKTHPQYENPDFLSDFNVNIIDKYIPFEFIDMSGVSIVIGLSGASLLFTGNISTISLLKLIYKKDSDYYTSQMEQLRQKKDIIFIKSIDELNYVLQKPSREVAQRS